MQNNLQNLILDSLESHSRLPAFHIGAKTYTYRDLSRTIDKIRHALRSISDKNDKHIGLVVSDDIETYAGIFACWLEGKAYVPLSSDTPHERNLNILEQAEVRIILESANSVDYKAFKVIATKELQDRPGGPRDAITYNHEDLAYIFFTSGTTGTPKGVPISFSNVLSFCDAFDDLGCNMTASDRCLQMFELTFDLSVMSYLIPVLKGACVYTIPKNEIKYSYIFELMEDQKLTFALMVPSMLQYLRPYFAEINCPDMRYNLFCGEALPLDITEEWALCLPNAKIMNVYGPTEATIFCTSFEFKRSGVNKTYNGVLSIGKPMKDVETIIVDTDNNMLSTNEKGELCLAGAQLTNGYWKNPEKNTEVFFATNYKEGSTRFYRTGDLCYTDDDGDIMYSGRVDFQAKIQGFRVELSEVELYAKEASPKTNAVAVAFKNGIGNMEIGLVIESDPIPTTPILDYMKSKIPLYMVPTRILFIEKFPLNPNEKIDRKKLADFFRKKQYA